MTTANPNPQPETTAAPPADPPKEIVPRDQRRAELEQLTFRDARSMWQPQTGRDLLDMANLMSTAGFMVKADYRGRPGDCMGLIALCAPYGINPLAASWKTYRAAKENASQDQRDAIPIAFEAQLVVAMINASGVLAGAFRYEFAGDGPTRQVTVTGAIRTTGEVLTLTTPTVGQIVVKNSPLWKSDPDQQLCYYAGRAWVRRYKPEMLLGVIDIDELEAGMAPPAGPDHARDITPERAPRRGGVVYHKVAAEPKEDEGDSPEVVIEDAEPEKKDQPADFFPGDMVKP